jgi:putative heme iron utilization protein
MAKDESLRAEPDDPVARMRALVRRERSGVLSSAHAEQDGWPFGSVTPYALTAEGDPVLLLSDLAEHTRNLRADSRASLLVQDPEGRDDPQAAGRVTLLGHAPPAQGAGAARAQEVYFARFPASRAHLSAHAFAVHVLRVEKVRWIAGFGTMGWLEREGWVDPLAPHADAILTHVNEDHADALATLAGAAGVRGTSARMTAVDSTGFDVDVAQGDGSSESVRLAFPAPASTPDAARQALIAMLGRARGASRERG